MRILLWHGYLLGGTGSNVYTRALAREWSRAGHDVVVVCQERAARSATTSAAPTVVRPDFRRPSARVRARPLRRARARSCSRTSPRASASAYVAANAAALRELLPADLVFANHVLLGGPVGAAAGAPFIVKAHGSELEYSMRGNDRSCRVGAGGARAARGRRTSAPSTSASVLEDVVGHVDRVHEVPPGVDVDDFVPEPRDEALAALLAEARARSAEPDGDERLPDAGNAERLAAFFAGDAPTVVYFGKLIAQQGRAGAPRGAARARRARA